MSAASSACDHIHDWFNGTAPGKWVSMGVYGDGSYGQPAGLIYSYPVTCQHGKWKIVQVRLSLSGGVRCRRFPMAPHKAK
jgi:malate dehydrogenase